LSGKAYVKLDEDDFEHGIERFWYFKIEKNIFTQNALLLNWSALTTHPLIQSCNKNDKSNKRNSIKGNSNL
jgi:hypothetical protein